VTRLSLPIFEEVPEIGRAQPRRDATPKALGIEYFAGDAYPANLLWAGVRRAGVPHARLASIDTASALAIPGVVAVLTHADVKGSNRFGVVRRDQPVLVEAIVRHAGDPLALVLAETPEALRRGIALIEPVLEPLPGVFDAEDALAADAVLLYPDEGTNLLLDGEIVVGDAAGAFDACAAVVEACIETPWQDHAALETPVGVAVVEPDGRLVMTVSTQTPFRDRGEIAEALGLPEEGIRVIAPFLGGGFGGKDGITIQCLLGLAALHAAGRPVRMELSREESVSAGVKRHRTRLYYRLGAAADGALQALDARIYFDTGPYDHLGGAVMMLGLEHAGGPYRIPHVRLRAWSVRTNNPVAGAFRGFGVTQVTAAIEQMIDRLALALGKCPLEMRRHNAVRRGDRNAVGTTVLGPAGLVDCLDRLAAHPWWISRESWIAAAGLFKRRGIGIAALHHGTGYGPIIPDSAGAKIELTGGGRFRIYCGVADMGQGNSSTFLQIAGAILGQPMEAFDLLLPDTDRTLPSGSASASRTTSTFGIALTTAATVLRERLLCRAADAMMVPSADEFVLLPGSVRHLSSGRDFPLGVLAQRLPLDDRVAVAYHRMPGSRERPDAPPAMRLHGFPHRVFGYGAHLARVEVDELTGQVAVLDYLAVNESGAVLNPQLYEQQLQGAVAQGLGLAIWEDFKVERGLARTRDFDSYAIPTALDLPDLATQAISLYDENGPFGMKGVGEIAVNGPAVANAVAVAIKRRIDRFPLTPERVLAALDRPSEMP